MAQMSISTLEAFLSQLEDKEIKPQFQEESTLYNLIQVNTSAQYVNGKGYKLHPYLIQDGSNAYYSEGGSFPAGGQQQFANFYIFPVRYAKTFDVTGDVLEDLRSGSGSSLLDFAQYIQMLNTSAIHELEQAGFGDGRGIKATFSGAAGTTLSFVVPSPPSTTWGATKGVEFLLPATSGAVYDIVTSAGAVTDTGVTLATINHGSTATAIATVAPPSGNASSGSWLVYTGSYNKVPRGLAYLVDNSATVFQMLSRATYPQLKSVVEDAAGAGITVQIASKLKKKIKYRSGVEAGKGLSVVTSLSQMDGYERLGYNLRRFGAADTTFDQSFEKIKHGDSVFMPALSCDEDRMYFLDLTDIARYERKPFGFFDYDGLKLRQKAGSNATGADAWYGNIGAKFNLGLKQPKNHGLIKRLGSTDLATEVGAWT